jgi:chemotaxis response regulator CheB/chemotaxis methyl-accepting protein methylase
MISLTEEELKVLYNIVTKLTGTYQEGNSKKEIIEYNVLRLIEKTHSKNLIGYLNLIQNNLLEYSKFISAITIHTTSWFRENEHFKIIQKHVLSEIEKNKGRLTINIWSAGCSTGQEPYTLAFYLEDLRRQFPNFDYKIIATDIDAISLKHASKAIFKKSELLEIPKQFHHYILSGTKKLKSFFTLTKAIRDRVHFDIFNLENRDKDLFSFPIDLVICRNVLIYFHPDKCSEIIAHFQKSLKLGGILVLGHSESWSEKRVGFESIGRACYKKTQQEKKKLPQKIPSSLSPRILVVDDLPVMRTLLRALLTKKSYDVMEASQVSEAEKLLDKYEFDLISLDLNMPGKNGATWLRELRSRGVRTPVVIVSASSADDAKDVYGALSMGAQEYFEKEKLSSSPQNYLEAVETFTKKIIPDYNNENKEEAALLDIPENLLKCQPGLILVGASTGGPEAIWKLLKDFPQPVPPIVIVQHTNPYYASHFAYTVSRESGLKISGAHDRVKLESNTIYISHGDYHIKIHEKNSELYLLHDSSSAVLGHRPAINILYDSATKININMCAILLTGMGKDGAQGMKDLSLTEKSFNMIQSKDSCVVYGMPYEARKLGAAHFSGDITQIRNKLMSLLKNKNDFKVKVAA